jgi:hypothetical protein
MLGTTRNVNKYNKIRIVILEVKIQNTLERSLIFGVSQR